MQITSSQLIRAVPSVNKTRAAELAKVFTEWGAKFGINTPLRAAHWLSQVFYESIALNAVEENLSYSAQGLLKTFPKYFNATTAQQYAHKPKAIASRVYANRMGNGSEASGDGYRYRGRGIIQLTGRENYAAYQQSGFCNGDLVSHPEWLAQSPGAYKSAMWFWWENGLSAIADEDNGLNANDVCKRITKRVNGGTNGLSDRQYYLRRFKRELGV